MEDVDVKMRENVPVFTEDESRELNCSDAPFNFILREIIYTAYTFLKTLKEQVDCIYIDPPYNTGASDWKYNNNYVDEKDSYRHSNG